MKLWRGPQGQKNNKSEQSLAREQADDEPPFDAGEADRADIAAPPLGDIMEDEEPVPPRRRRRAEPAYSDSESAYAEDAPETVGDFADERAADGAPAAALRARRRKPWILRALAVLGIICACVGRLIWKYARRNIVLALGVAVFGAIFLVVLFNAFFHQKTVSRPVLFSTRADSAADSGHQPYVEKVISTKALDREPQADSNMAAPDVVGEFVAQKTKEFDQEQGRKELAASETDIGKMIARADAPAAKSSLKQGNAGRQARPVPLPAPAPDEKFLPTHERVLKLQKALQKAGERGLDINGVWNEKTRAALRHFQRTHGLKATGEIDGAVIAKMQRMRIW